MNEGLSVVFALVLLSAMLSVILAIAWATMGRARHARTWATAFGLASVQWGINIAHYFHGGSALFLLTNTLSVIVASLLALGFFQRAGKEGPRVGLMIGGAATVALIFACVIIAPHPGIVKSAPLLFRAIVLAMAIAAIPPPDRATNAAEKSAIGMLWVFVTFNILVAATALTLGGGTSYYVDLDRWMLLLGLPVAFTGTGLFAVFLLASDLSERMRQLASRDPLTGVLNRRGFEEQATVLIANAVRQRQPLALALADLDRFKTVNDVHGHAAGDALLCHFARQMDCAVRQGDVFARLGGEEFVLLLVNTTGEAAMAVVDRLRREAATQTLPTTPPLMVTTSFGVAELRDGEMSLAALVARADLALYRSKQEGRDRVTLAACEEAASA